MPNAELASLIKLPAIWPAPDNIVAFTSCRVGGVSTLPFESLNLALHVGDQQQAVTTNRERLIQSCDDLVSIQWLNQVHGNHVVSAAKTGVPDADACYTLQARLGCAVMTADCLPILICDRQGQQVAAVHAGWRGLAGGVIENTVAAFSSANHPLVVWLGPAISQAQFEVGLEVRQAFIDAATDRAKLSTDQAFLAHPSKPEHFYADLYQLARLRFLALGIEHVYGGEHCCYSDPQRFFSYRRDHTTGRMVSLIYKRC